MEQLQVLVEYYVYEYLQKNYKDVAKVFKKHITVKPESSKLPSLQHIIEFYLQHQNYSEKLQEPNVSSFQTQKNFKTKDSGNSKSKNVNSNSNLSLGKKNNNKVVSSKNNSSDSSDDFSSLIYKKSTTPVDKVILNIKNKPINVPNQIKDNEYNIINTDSDSENKETIMEEENGDEKKIEELKMLKASLKFKSSESGENSEEELIKNNEAKSEMSSNSVSKSYKDELNDFYLSDTFELKQLNSKKDETSDEELVEEAKTVKGKVGSKKQVSAKSIKGSETQNDKKLKKVTKCKKANKEIGSKKFKKEENESEEEKVVKKQRIKNKNSNKSKFELNNNSNFVADKKAKLIKTTLEESLKDNEDENLEEGSKIQVCDDLKQNINDDNSDNSENTIDQKPLNKAKLLGKKAKKPEKIVKVTKTNKKSNKEENEEDSSPKKKAKLNTKIESKLEEETKLQELTKLKKRNKKALVNSKK